jgi:hypothetical protein
MGVQQMTGPVPSSVTLNVQPEALPAVRAAFEDALTELQGQLLRLNQGGFIPRPWLLDPVSEETRVFYNTTVMEAGDGSLSALLAYQTELTRILESLKAMEDNYSRTEGDVAGLVRPIP